MNSGSTESDSAHHQSDDGYLPCPLVFAAAAGARTKRIRIRISILLALLYDPLHLAEEVAVADLCTQGRLDLALGVGYVEDDFNAFGVDYHRRGKSMEELIPFLRRAWTGESFPHRGVTVRVTPRPCQDPMPIYIGGGASRKSIERAARLADGFFPPGMRKPWEAYRQTCMELDKPDPGDWRPHGPIFLWVTTDDKQRAWERLAPHIRHQIDSYGAWTKAGLGKATGPYIPSGDLESLSQDGAYQVVTPDEAVELAHQLGPAGDAPEPPPGGHPSRRGVADAAHLRARRATTPWARRHGTSATRHMKSISPVHACCHAQLSDTG